MSEATVPESVLASLSSRVRDGVSQLPRENQELFLREYRKRKKRVPMAYLLCLAYGTHLVYLEKTDLAFWFWLTAGALLIWWVIDLFRIPGMVREYNRNCARIVLADVKPGKFQPRF